MRGAVGRSIAGLLVIAAACASGASGPATQGRASPIPVLFVHGSGMSGKSFGRMLRAFEQRGYPRDYLLAVEMRPDDGDNRLAAETFIADGAAKLIDDASRAHARLGLAGTAPRKIAIVAHSMGAASSRWFVARLRPELVDSWISIAGANHGTDALCGRPGAGDRQMCPAFARRAANSALQVTLNGTADAPLDESPYGAGMDASGVTPLAPDERRRLCYFTIRIEPDAWVRPAASALLDGAGTGAPLAGIDAAFRETRPGNYRLLEDTKHDALLRNARVVELVARLIEGCSSA